MELINLSNYDLSFEKQFMNFMIRFLMPYILFKKPQLNDKPIPKQVNIYRTTLGSWNSGIHPLHPNPTFRGLIPPNRPGTKELGLEIISFEEFIHFLHCILPKIIQDEIKTNKKELDFVGIKQEILKQPQPHKGKTIAVEEGGVRTLKLVKPPFRPNFILPRFMNGDEDFERANELIQELNQFNKQEIDEEIKQTNQKFMKLTEKNQYLKKVQKIHREKNGSINKIIYFLQNLDYLGIDNTEDYSWTLIPEPVLNV